MNHSTPGLPIHHQLPEFTQIHVHRVGDPIQPSHPLSSPSLLPPIPPTIRVFSNESTLRMRWPKYWSFSLSITPSSEHPQTSINLGIVTLTFCTSFSFTCKMMECSSGPLILTLVLRLPFLNKLHSWFHVPEEVSPWSPW